MKEFSIFLYFRRIIMLELDFIFYILAVIIGIQLFYYFFFYLRIVIAKPIVNVPVVQSPVSIIICAHNEKENLRKLIPLLLQQNYSDFEVIIVDDRSQDGSYDYFDKSIGFGSRFRIIRIEATPVGVAHKKYALTKGIEAARYELLLLTDADCMPLSDYWISSMSSKLMGEKEIVLGYSPYQRRGSFLNILIRYETLFTAIQYFSFALAGFSYMGVGRNILYKKSLFEKNGGFNTHIGITGGDDDLFIREVATEDNVGVCLNRKGQMESLPKENYISWFIQKRRHLSVGVKYKWKHKLLLGLQSFTHILYYIIVVFAFYIDYQSALWFLMIRSLVFVLIFVLIARKLEDDYKWWRLLLLIDIVYIFNYLLITTSLVLYKKVKWN